MKVTISIADDLMERIDNYAKTNYLSRSGFISLACTQYLNQNEAMSALNEMNKAMQKIAESGEINDEAKKQLDYFEKLFSAINS